MTRLQAVEGIYRNGKVELLEAPSVPEGVHVIVTFLDVPAKPDGSTGQSGSLVDLVIRGITPEHAVDLRSRLQPFAEVWESPEMDVFDGL